MRYIRKKILFFTLTTMSIVPSVLLSTSCEKPTFLKVMNNFENKIKSEINSNISEGKNKYSDFAFINTFLTINLPAEEDTGLSKEISNYTSEQLACFHSINNDVYVLKKEMEFEGYAFNLSLEYVGSDRDNQMSSNGQFNINMSLKSDPSKVKTIIFILPIYKEIEKNHKHYGYDKNQRQTCDFCKSLLV
ncbi:hypothetical protein [Mycoplasmopsis pullorum]|uniref:Lipoprotein n=1 Tax=Mycoplasmopsis pullorum TaxID=48003 RepID=A0A1L4FS56_9BACT|nr:hypothetical protein [Mycoplasmopsis pullorum]APJ38436.1 hypothetical protein BLA55_02035 [Mycoplasmopsis pullorum]